MRPKHLGRRRGVLLIIILALLAMFALIAVAFVILTGHASSSAKSIQRVEQYHDPPQAELHRALMQVLRGPPTEYSAIGPHSLLEDVYGGGSVAGAFVDTDGFALVSRAGGELVEFEYKLLDNSGSPTVTDSYPYYRPGCVLTVVSGAYPGQSTHIVGVNPSSGKLQARPFREGTPSAGDKFVINGVPFSGTGFGYDADDPGDPKLDESSSTLGQPVALLPGDPDNLSTPGGANEDYDAPDFQNMILAAQYYDPGDGTIVTIPSLHRPALVNYWFPQPYVWGTNPDLERAVILRPMPQDHFRDTDGNGVFDPGEPHFTGSNPNFYAAWDGQFIDTNSDDICDYAWDVDNDGDGFTDSVWVDLGFPVRSASDGRLYKPLFAILCVDLDGRLNVNAHGCWAQTGYAQADVGKENASDDNYDLPDEVIDRGFAFAGGSTQVTLPRGLGHGPADVNLLPLFEDPDNPGTLLADWSTHYQSLLGGSATLGLYGRYGEDVGALPGWSNTIDPLAFNQHPDYPSNLYGFVLNSGDTSYLTSYGSPPDYKCRMALGLDPRGEPLYTMQGNLWADANGDHPYECDVSAGLPRGIAEVAMVDNPFSTAELERILRPFDRDATALPSRLYALTYDSVLGRSPLVDHRHMVTTDSVDLPTPGVVTPGSFTTPERNTLPGNRVWHVSDLLVAKGVARAYWPYLLPWEMLSGLKMDLNRPLGDGYDSNGNGVVDEPEEFGADLPRCVDVNGDPIDADALGLALNHVNGIDVNNDGSVDDADRAMARQLAARYLFVLAMLLREPQYSNYPQEYDGEPGLSGPERRELWVRRLAQWAINAVEFRDGDSIMTPFEYDDDPFTDENDDGNPWDVDGVIGSDDDGADYRGLVWGCERPELLLTECFAMHDRRVVDSDFDRPDRAKRTDDTEDPEHEPDDDDLDQPRIPQGSAFFELYCTRRASDPVAPGDLYGYDHDTADRWYLDLGRLAPAGTDGLEYPVWRLAISRSHQQSEDSNLAGRLAEKPHSTSLQPDQMSLLRGADEPDIDIERIVWFTAQQPAGHHADDFGDDEPFEIYYRRGGGTSVGILPGGYAVVGPRQITDVGAAKGGNLYDRSEQHVEIIPGGAIDSRDTSDISTMPVIDSQIKSPVGIICAADPPAVWTDGDSLAPNGIGISVSEPLPSGGNYYDPPESGISTTGPNGEKEWYGDPDQSDLANAFLDRPLDRPGDPDNHMGELTIGTGTEQNYRTVLLQRLANPLEPYDPQTNPYITVDWSPIDLTVFNGQDTEPDGWPEAFGFPAGTVWDTYGATHPDKPVCFETRQRGGSRTDGALNTPSAQASPQNLWEQISWDPAETTGTGDEVHFDHVLKHTLGYLNRGFQADPGAYFPPSGAPGLTSPDEYVGGPPEPFPWLVWNNRPYVGQNELMLVPSSHPGRLLWEFRFEDGADPPPDPYGPGERAEVSYPYLLNFFHSAPGNQSPQLHRLLDFVHVRSPFVGTDEQGDPTIFADPDHADYDEHHFRAPFSRISRYREPGRVNLNTVYSEQVWRGLLNYFPSGNPASASSWQWSQFVRSRRGYDATSMFGIDASYPTRFARPFRTAAGGQLVPVDALKPSPEVDATLLRHDPDPAVTPEQPLLRSEQTEAYRDTDRNPYFRYQALSRLSNLVTTRSNVYAIWITVGYFEVEARPAGYDTTIYPDGYRLGQELGTDTGEVTRHRAFYIIDRTIPVGFERGYDLNAEKAILLKRFIE